MVIPNGSPPEPRTRQRAHRALRIRRHPRHSDRDLQRQPRHQQALSDCSCSLNMIIELGDAFDFTGADLTR
jgi:hypothetical protein